MRDCIPVLLRAVRESSMWWCVRIGVEGGTRGQSQCREKGHDVPGRWSLGRINVQTLQNESLHFWWGLLWHSAKPTDDWCQPEQWDMCKHDWRCKIPWSDKDVCRASHCSLKLDTCTMILWNQDMVHCTLLEAADSRLHVLWFSCMQHARSRTLQTVHMPQRTTNVACAATACNRPDCIT